MSALTGTLRAGGAPAADAVVLAAEPDGGSVLAATTTGADGGFVLDGLAGPVRVFAKAGAGEAVGLAARMVDVPASGPLSMALEDHAPLHPVTVIAEGEVPPELDLQLTPRAIEGLDEAALALLHAPVDGVSEPMLVRRPIGEARRVALQMQTGSWILYSALDSAPDALGADMPHLAWRVTRATLESGEELGAAVIGYALEVAGPLTVTLHVTRRVVAEAPDAGGGGH